MYKPALITGSLLGALAVILGAMGAHALEKHVSQDVLKIYQKGVEYQFYHVFAVLACGILYASYPFPSVKYSFWFFLLGIVCFSGSLYLLTLLKMNGRGLGVFNLIPPVGGLFFIAGWIMLLVSFLRKQQL